MLKHLEEYNSRGRGWASEEEFYAEYIELKYEARDADHNWVARIAFPLPRHGKFFPRTIEYFLRQEKIKMN